MPNLRNYTEDDRLRLSNYMDWYEQHCASNAKPDREYVWSQVEAGEMKIYMRPEDKEKWGKVWGGVDAG